MRIRTWADLTPGERAEVEEDLRLAVRSGVAAVDNEGGPPVVFDPHNNTVGWDLSEWRQLDIEAREHAAADWFEKRKKWPP